MLAIKKKIRKRFKNLKFNEELHEYRVKGRKLPSTSFKISNYYKPFDATKYPKHLQEIWKEINKVAIDLGNSVHNFAEDYKLGLSPKCTLVQHRAIIKFWDELPSYYELVSVELRMHDDGYAGTADFILLDTRDNTLVIGDYKTNKDLFKWYGFMISPFNFLPDCPYNHYQLQLSYYQNLLSPVHPVSSRMLVHIIGENYKVYYPKDFTKCLIDDK